jgi:glycosyltransferase involved in cell wall biosynthesis
MNIAYVTSFNAQSLNVKNNWSGTSYYIAQSLAQRSLPIDYLGPLDELLAGQLVSKFKSFYYKNCGKQYIKYIEPLILKDYAKQISRKLERTKSDIIFSATSDAIAYLDDDRPMVFWADATFENLIDFYPAYSNLCQESIDRAHFIQKTSLEKAQLAIYSSEWAAQSAINYYHADPDKVKVVPFGANIDGNRSLSQIKATIANRPSDRCKLLFLGVDWYRKGGDIALQVAEELNQLGLDTELTVVGCQPIIEGDLPSFVKSLGYISKSTPAGKEQIERLIADAHFLILPSRAECYGIVFCEANSFGVPCISQKTGGIPTIIKDDLNGKLFDRDSDTSQYAEYIYRLFEDYARYQQLALSAFNEYDSRLNWRVAGQQVSELLATIA